MSTFRYSLIFLRRRRTGPRRSRSSPRRRPPRRRRTRTAPCSAPTGRRRAGWRSPAAVATPEPLSTMPGPSGTESRWAPIITIRPGSPVRVCAMTLRPVRPPVSPSRTHHRSGCWPRNRRRAAPRHVLDARLVAAGPGGPVAAVLVGDLLQRLQVRQCPGIAHLTGQLLHQWPVRLRRGGPRRRCYGTAGRSSESDRDPHERESDARPG